MNLYTILWLPYILSMYYVYIYIYAVYMLSTCYLYASCMLHIDYLYAISMQSNFHSIFLRAVIHLYFPMIGHVHIIHFTVFICYNI